MSQHDMNVANDTGPNVRTDINNALGAIATMNAGAAAPSTTFAGLMWIDTTNSLIKQRNQANSAWVTIGGLDTTNWGLASLSATNTHTGAIENWQSGLTEQANGSAARVLSTAGEITLPLQPSFLAKNSAEISNATGDGTTHNNNCDTELIDRNADYNNGTGVFTAPKTGLYMLGVQIHLRQLAAGHTSGEINLVTSNRTWQVWAGNPGAIRNASDEIQIGASVIVDMDAADTASLTVAVSGATKVVDVGAATYFFGFLLG